MLEVNTPLGTIVAKSDPYYHIRAIRQICSERLCLFAQLLIQAFKLFKIYVVSQRHNGKNRLFSHAISSHFD